MISYKRHQLISATILTAWIFGFAVLARAEDASNEHRLDAIVEESRFLSSGAARRPTGKVFLEALVLPQKEAARLDVSPFLRRFTEFLRDHGIPLHPQRDASGHEALGVAATFRLREELPAVRFQAGEAGEAGEPLAAFYSDKGFRCSVVWPARFLSFRLEGGEDSEFGYFGIAGAQWAHPERPLAVGFGIPLNLRDASGAVGFVLQMRLKLD